MWDLMVASNVIHATSDIKSALRNTRSALKPGGKMILLEITQSQLGAGLVYGTLSNFWKGDLDRDFPRLMVPSSAARIRPDVVLLGRQVLYRNPEQLSGLECLH